MFKNGHKYWRGSVIGMIAAAAALSLWRLGGLESMEVLTWTWRARSFARKETPSHEVKLILLDQASLDWGQRENTWGWPWPREAYGAIAAFCKRGGARTLVFDLLFTEPSVYGVADDAAMGQALSVGPPAVLTVISGGSTQTWPEYIPHPDRTIDLPFIKAYKTLLFPVPEVVSGASAVGHVIGTPDRDGIFRRISPFCRFDGVSIPTLGLAAWLTGGTGSVSISASDGQLLVGDKIIPLDRHGDAILRFKGPDGFPQAVSAAAVIQSELRLQEGEASVLSSQAFKDCYVFVACSAPALLDLRPVPVNSRCPGAVLHATFVDNLLTDSFIADAPVPIVILGVMATAVAAAVCLTYGGRWWQAGPLSVVWLGIPIAAGFIEYAQGRWWPVAAHEMASALGLVGALAMNYWAEGRQKAFIKRAFRQYLSGEVIEKILRDPRHLQLGGEKRELTILFTDLAGFSTISERLGPVELTALLNDYLSEMTDIILEEGGTLDKYEGDAIMAFWNAPLEQADHAVRACRAGLRCQRRLAELRQTYQQRTGAELRMRVGIHTGEVVVGNMGSHKRFNYTILGDAANLASRLEGANKAFGTETMVSEKTWRLVSSEFNGRKLADLRVIGRETAVAVYELTGFATEPEPSGWDVFAAGVRCFREGDFMGATKAFEKLPNDAAAQNYIRRCAELDAQDPGSWDGVWRMTGK
ncbi:MAG: adenylate/guanylate cyclase domain-containing protein [Sedimentisphaerales bacterium]|nr:adenylate/guanylate cyclase domain-containing protein [Sedimentisphaerales bacterium]